jgi:hypothetical protein
LRAARAETTRDAHEGAICDRFVGVKGNSAEKTSRPEQGWREWNGYAAVNAPPPRPDGGAMNNVVCKPVLANPSNLRERKSLKSFMEPDLKVKK